MRQTFTARAVASVHARPDSLTLTSIPYCSCVHKAAMLPRHRNRARGALPSLGAIALLLAVDAATITVANPPPLGSTAPFTGVLTGLTPADGAGLFKARGREAVAAAALTCGSVLTSCASSLSAPHCAGVCVRRAGAARWPGRVGGLVG